jgi:uncharacterized protein YndB with AHSA1/START domain
MPDIQHRIEIAATPEVVYPLIATGRGFHKWWAMDITKRRGALELGFFKRTTVYRLRLSVDDMPVEADWVCETGDEWNGTHIIFRLEEKGAGTLLRFTHAGWQAETDYFTSCNTTWGELMFRVKATAEGKSRGPLFLASDMAY